MRRSIARFAGPSRSLTAGLRPIFRRLNESPGPSSSKDGRVGHCVSRAGSFRQFCPIRAQASVGMGIIVVMAGRVPRPVAQSVDAKIAYQVSGSVGADLLQPHRPQPADPEGTSRAGHWCYTAAPPAALQDGSASSHLPPGAAAKIIPTSRKDGAPNVDTRVTPTAGCRAHIWVMPRPIDYAGPPVSRVARERTRCRRWRPPVTAASRPSGPTVPREVPAAAHRPPARVPVP